MRDGGGQAQKIAQQRLMRAPVFLDPDERPKTKVEAYTLQSDVNQQLIAQLGPIAGYKIGCTTPVMRAFLGIDTPCAGDVFAKTVYRRSAKIEADAYRKVGVECEIVALIGSDLKPQNAPYSIDTIAPYVAALAAGIEIVDDRYLDYRTLGVETLIADNFFNAGAVLSDPYVQFSSPQLPNVKGVMTINGKIVGEGYGASVMGHPFHSLAWLANARAEHGLGIAKGTFVFLGSLVETKWLARGDHVSVDIDGIGSAELDVI